MQRAFSLVELSIVLVILGLLTGGILGGQSLIRAAELRSVTTQMQKFSAAANSFKVKYFSPPGDFALATQVWPASISMNGNGDGTVGMNFVSGEYAPGLSETGRFWPELALAGMIEGTYTASSSALEPNISGPASRISPGVWGAATMQSSAFTAFDAFSDEGISTNIYTRRDYGNALVLGETDYYFMPSLPLFTPQEAWNIDSKIDDGKPATGAVSGGFWNNLCSQADAGAPSATNLAASYRLSDSQKQCLLIFAQAY